MRNWFPSSGSDSTGGPAAAPGRRARRANETTRIVRRYLGAALITAAGLGLAFLFQGMRGLPDGLVFTASVALTARYLGLGPSLFATVLSMLAIDYLMVPPLGRLEFTHPEEATYFLVFMVLALVISGMTHSLRSARAVAESHAAQLVRVNAKLAAQSEETRRVSEHLHRTNAELARARDSAERLASRADRLLAVTTALSEAQMPEEVGRVVTTRGFDVLEAVAGMIAMLDGSGVLRVLDRRRPASVPGPRPAQLGLDEETPVTTALRHREPVWLESPQRYQERFPAAAERFHPEQLANAFLAIPLMHGDEAVGVMLLGFQKSSAVGAADHAFAGILAGAVGDALARARTLEREREDRRNAQLLLRAREEVLSVVAHDLRNPLGVVGAVIQLLNDDEVKKAERDKLVLSGTRAVHRMGRLVSDLLDVMRMEAGRVSLETEDLAAGAVLAQAEEAARRQAREQEVALVVEPVDPSLRLRADRGRLAQLFDNLLSNAIKFTAEGGRVTLRARAQGDDLIFDVADTGSGIPPEHVSHLFDRFWQGAKGDRRGVGLGLAIVKGIVDAHGGRVWVDTEVGKGSTFHVAFPRLRALEQHADSKALSSSRS